jgi:BirA family transcriptional regulator, biotin operon repressor / biotin---[acetyl-CoA-carboxylase] ligase
MRTDPRGIFGPGRDPILADLGTRIVGRYIRRHDSVSSTNDLALSLTEIPVPEGTVIIAEEQTSGRGRLGRTWASPRGGVWLSVILRPGLPLETVPVVGLAAAIATAQAIRKTTALLARLKWPNDVLVEGKKVVGILAETPPAADWVVVGIGINANVPQEVLPEVSGYPATSLQVLLGHPVDREALIRALLRELDQGYAVLKSAGARAVLRRWREMAETLGREVQIEMPGAAISGTAYDIDEAGALLLRLEDGTVRRVMAGDIRMREVGR